jgi:hypothetical protein
MERGRANAWGLLAFPTNVTLNLAGPNKVFSLDCLAGNITLRRSVGKPSVSQTVVRGPQVVLGFCPCGPLRLNISPKKDRNNKINVNCVSHTVVENLKQFVF